MRLAVVGFLGLLAAQEPAGTPDQLTHHWIARLVNTPDKVEPALELAARNSPVFGARYAVILIDLRRALEAGRGYEAEWLALAQASPAGGPAGAADHLRALAKGFKDAVYCRECKNGRVECPRCKGKKTVDLTCPKCEGKCRVKAPGQVGNSNVTQRCNNCNATGVFKNAPCPECDKGGTIACGACTGRPWHDRPCSRKDCRGGRIPCPTCQGRTKVAVKCAECGGKGRTRAVGATEDSNASVKCRACDGKGTLKEEAPCPGCTGSKYGLGLDRCPECASGAKGPQVLLSSVYTTEPCAACKGSGWPNPKEAAACPKCLGLGVRVKPVADPAKVLD
jgi:hypothetical protein